MPSIPTPDYFRYLGCVKAPAVAERVEYPGAIASHELNNTVRLLNDTGLANRIFYISAMYEFSHS
jgi:hypothetical protein